MHQWQYESDITPSTITFNDTVNQNWVMRITPDRKIEVNEDVEVTEAAQKVLAVLQELMNQQTQEPVACPYPCGWNNLLEITTRKGAYLVTHFDADNPMPYSYWQEISSMVDTARTLVKWAMQLKAHPAPQPAQSEYVVNSGGTGTELRKPAQEPVAYDYSAVYLLTHSKTKHIIERNDFRITGFVLTSPNGEEKCISDCQAVRWISTDLFFKMVHSDSIDTHPAPEPN